MKKLSRRKSNHSSNSFRWKLVEEEVEKGLLRGSEEIWRAPYQGDGCRKGTEGTQIPQISLNQQNIYWKFLYIPKRGGVEMVKITSSITVSSMNSAVHEIWKCRHCAASFLSTIRYIQTIVNLSNEEFAITSGKRTTPYLVLHKEGLKSLNFLNTIWQEKGALKALTWWWWWNSVVFTSTDRAGILTGTGNFIMIERDSSYWSWLVA